MASRNNFLLGFGERLQRAVNVPSRGGPKEPPYTLEYARQRLQTPILEMNEYFDTLPGGATPNDEAVCYITLHPRYVAKSEYPDALLNRLNLRVIGSKSLRITPEEWGVKNHPEEEITESLFVAGKKLSFKQWQASLTSQDMSSDDEIIRFERVGAYSASMKLRGLAESSAERKLLEVVLHNAGDQGVIDAFNDYAEGLGAEVLRPYRRDIKSLTFVPVRISEDKAERLAEFSFLRVLRPMPQLRPLAPKFLRGAPAVPPELPNGNAIDSNVKAVIFDGGLPDNAPKALGRWLRYIEPHGIGKPVPFYQEHGLAVSSAFLFGDIKAGKPLPTPFCMVDHVRVLDEQSGTGGDLMCLDALRRIHDHLEKNPGYEFVNLSLGPSLPIDDDEVTEWTAFLDDQFASGRAVVTVAVGNDGEETLNRLQPPSDGVNVLSVGAATSEAKEWQKASWSCIGPGRSPGYVKPDGLAFGGTETNRFNVLDSTLNISGTYGTSFAAPYVLRACASLKVQTGTDLSPMAIRALMIHKANPEKQARVEVGWGRFEVNPTELLICDDDETMIVFQDKLPVGEHLRLPVPMPDTTLEGMVQLKATLLISPEVDPDRPGAYTRSGLQVSFRPHSQNFVTNEDGSVSTHPVTETFFSAKHLYPPDQAAILDNHFKWEPCLVRTIKKYPHTLHEPAFDIYYHHREGGGKASFPEPIPYAFIITLKAPKMTSLYDQVLSKFANILVPLKPRIDILIKT